MLRVLTRNYLRSRSSIPGAYRSWSRRWQTTRPTPELSTPELELPKTTLPQNPPDSSSNHNSLATFLKYAKEASLSSSSTTYVGTHYEYLCQSSLQRLGFTLHRIGGRSDAGIDLLGTWQLPSLPYPLRVIVQCKALKTKARPSIVRELEGAFAGAPSGWRGEAVVAVLVTAREATKGVRDAIRRFGRPVVLVMLENLGEGEGRVRQVLWNQKVAEIGVEGVGAQVRYLPGKGDGDGVGDGGEYEEGVDTEVVLTWKGEVWEPGGNGEKEKGD